MDSPVVSLQGVSKQFGAVTANKDVNLDLYSGRICALLGENGAGKSTLMSMLAGRYLPTKGRICLHGNEKHFTSPAQALEAGVGMVYQRFMLIESMTVIENLTLAAGKKIKGDIHLAITETAEQYGLEIVPEKYIYELSMGERQRVEIIKLLMLDAEVLIFDEPTAVLSPPEIDALFTILDRLRKDGKVIVFITHKLEEVLRLADTLAIMRKGRLILTSQVDIERMSKSQLAKLMVGRDVVLRVEKKEVPPGKTVFSVRNFSGKNPLGGTPFQAIDFDIRKGEIFSIIGVAGNGQSGLISAITGISAADEGEIIFADKHYTPLEWSRTNKKDIAYVPEDRYHTGAIGSMSIAENFGLTRLSAYSSGFCSLRLERGKMIYDSMQAIEKFQIKAESCHIPARSLSGGNLQKVILARELARQPALFIAEQPTQGLDIAATEDIWKAILTYRENGAVLLVTGDLKEVLSLSDRIGVIYNGRLIDIIDATSDEDVGRVGLLMAGVQ